MQRGVAFCGVMVRKPIAIPATDVRQNDDPNEREQGKPDDGFLSAINDNRGREQRAERAAGIAADLENRLGETEPPAGAQVCNARCFRMENGGAKTDERYRNQNEPKIRRE